MNEEKITPHQAVDDLVALGRDDVEDLLLRANATYTSSRRPPLPRARPFIIGQATLEPLFDRALGRNHVIKGRYEAGTVSALHRHNADQYIVIIAGSGEVRTEMQSHELRPGMVVWIPKEQPHIHAAANGEALEYILFTATGHTAELLDHQGSA